MKKLFRARIHPEHVLVESRRPKSRIRSFGPTYKTQRLTTLLETKKQNALEGSWTKSQRGHQNRQFAVNGLNWVSQRTTIGRENREDSLICLLFAGVRRGLSEDVVKEQQTRSSYEGTISSAGGRCRWVDWRRKKKNREGSNREDLPICLLGVRDVFQIMRSRTTDAVLFLGNNFLSRYLIGKENKRTWRDAKFTRTLRAIC